MDVAFPRRAVVGRPVALEIMIRDPEAPGLRDTLGACPADFDASVEDIHTSDDFIVDFGRTNDAGVRRGLVSVEIQVEGFDQAVCAEALELLADCSKRIGFTLVPKRAGHSQILVTIRRARNEPVLGRVVLRSNGVSDEAGAACPATEVAAVARMISSPPPQVQSEAPGRSETTSSQPKFLSMRAPLPPAAGEGTLRGSESSASVRPEGLEGGRPPCGMARLTGLPPGLIRAPEWAQDAGVDLFGCWVAIALDRAHYRMRWITEGQFAMGAPASEEGRFSDDGPLHEVKLSRGFWLGETPVTQDIWEAVMGGNPSYFKGTRRPVESVSWEDCQMFCARLHERFQGLSARLPTEAEWEYACRAGTSTSTYVGGSSQTDLDRIAWWRGDSHRESHEVRGKDPNAWGLYDMVGNVWEWCGDWFGPYPSESVVDPTGPTEGSGRVYRGGGWDGLPRGCRSASRDGGEPSSQSRDLGFRLAAD